MEPFNPCNLLTDLKQEIKKSLCSSKITGDKIRSGIKRVIKSNWISVIEKCPENVTFRNFLRFSILESNKHHYPAEYISYWGLLCREVIRQKLDHHSEIKDICDQLIISDPNTEEFEKILSKNRRISRKFVLSLSNELFRYCANSREKKACIRTYLEFHPTGKKLSANQFCDGLNRLYNIHFNWFRSTNPRNVLFSYLRENQTFKLSTEEWERLSSDFWETIVKNPKLHLLLGPELLAKAKSYKEPVPECPFEITLKKPDSWSWALQILEHNRLLDNNQEGERARSLFLNPKFHQIEEQVQHKLFKKDDTHSLYYLKRRPTNLPRESHLKRISRYASASFICHYRIIAEHRTGLTTFLRLSDEEAINLLPKLPSDLIPNYLFKLLKETRLNIPLVKKFVNRAVKLGFTQLVTPAIPSSRFYHSDEAILYLNLTFPLWVKKTDFKTLFNLVFYFDELSLAYRNKENLQLIMGSLWNSLPEEKKVIRILTHLFGTNYCKNARKQTPLEFENILNQIFAKPNTPRGGYHKQLIAKKLFQEIPEYGWKILKENISPSNLLVCLRFLEINTKTSNRLSKLTDKNGELILFSTLSERNPTKGFLRLLEKVPVQLLIQIFRKKPRIVFPVLCERLGKQKTLKLILEDEKIRFILNQPFVKRSLIGKLNQPTKGKPGISLSSHAAVLFSMEDYKFIRFLSWHKTNQWKAGKRKGFFDDLYNSWTIPKKNGDPRKVSSPQPSLKRLQRRLLDRFLSKERSHRIAHGFVPGKGIVSNAKPHIRQKVVINLDIKDFFPSTTRQAVFSTLCGIKHLNPALAGFISDICCYQGALPIGAPTSPHLANLVLFSIDTIITKAARKIKAKYTRYADDLTISGDDRVLKLIPFVQKLLGEKGYSLNQRKINIFRPGRRQAVTGLTVNKKVSVPRAVRRNLRAAIHARQNQKSPTWKGRPANDAKLGGLCSFVRSVNRKHGNRLQKSLKLAINEQDLAA